MEEGQKAWFRERTDRIDEEKKKQEKHERKGVTESVVSRVGVVSVANIYALLSVIIGLIIGLFSAIVSCGIGAVAGMPGGFGLGFIGIIVLPILYGIMGWVSGAIGAALYNFVAGRVGGIKIELE